MGTAVTKQRTELSRSALIATVIPIAVASSRGRMKLSDNRGAEGEDNYGRAEDAYKNYRQKGLGQTQESHDLPDAHVSETRHKVRARRRSLNTWHAWPTPLPSAAGCSGTHPSGCSPCGKVFSSFSIVSPKKRADSGEVGPHSALHSAGTSALIFHISRCDVRIKLSRVQTMCPNNECAKIARQTSPRLHS